MLGPSFGSGLFFYLGKSAWTAGKTQDGANPGGAQTTPS